MADYRICSGCGKRNPVNVAICSCNTILLNCPILSDEDEGEAVSQTLFMAADLEEQTGQEYKRCAFCGHQHKPNVRFCIKCGRPLNSSPALAEETGQPVPSVRNAEPVQTAVQPPTAHSTEQVRASETVPPFPVASQVVQKYKQCPECGHLNDPQSENCLKCGETLEDVFDLIEAPEQSETIPEPKPLNTCPFYFISTEGVRADIPLGKSVFGRGAIMGEDIIKCESFFVSEEHLTVTCTPEYVEITDISRNGTFVNDNKITKGIPVRLNQGDLVGMGGVNRKLDPRGYFITLLRNS